MACFLNHFGPKLVIDLGYFGVIPTKLRALPKATFKKEDSNDFVKNIGK